MSASRASGPGGQNVNKVATKVELRVDLTRIEGLDAESLARLKRLVRTRLDRDGRLRVSSQRTRAQSRNLEDARDKIRAWILRALQPPARRIRTRPTSAERRRRLEAKRRRARLKQDRRAPTIED